MTEQKCAVYRVVHRESGKDYVGISVDHKRRWRQHRADALRYGRTYFHSALAKHGPDAFDWTVIAWARNFKIAGDLERLARHLGMGAYNLTMGGDGILGAVRSDSTRAKIRAAKTGLVIPDDVRAKIAETLRGRKTGPLSAEHRAKIGAAHRGKTLSPEARAKISAARTGSVSSDAVKARHAEDMRARWQDPEMRERMCTMNVGHKRSPETIARMQAAARARWARERAAKARA